MPDGPKLQVVVDTNVLLEGLSLQGGAPGLIIDAWRADLFQACVSNALAYEYADVLSRKLSARRWRTLRPVVGALLEKARFVVVYFSWRPISPDKADDHIIDCAMNAGAGVVTGNIRHFRKASESLGLPVWTPVELVYKLASEEN